MVRKISRFTARHSGQLILVALGLLVLGFLPPMFTANPALADTKVDNLKTVALSDIGLNQRLAVVDALKGNGSTDARKELIDIAKTGDLRIQAAACAALGRMK